MLWLSLLFLLNAEPDFSCRWGEKSELQIPDCGTPVRLRIQFPDETRGRFEFRRIENPGLSGYFHKKRDGQGTPKPFANLVNLFKVDLYFCPRDFITPRTLIFHHVGISQPRDYQCKLGPFSEGDSEENPPAMKEAGNDPETAAAGMGVLAAMAAPDAMSPPDGMAPHAANRPEPAPDVTSGIVPPPRWPSSTEDSFARTLAAAALGVGVLAILLWAFFAARVARRLRRLASEQAPVLALTASDKRPADE